MAGISGFLYNQQRGWSDLLQWLQTSFSAKGIFIEELLVLQERLTATNDHDTALSDILRGQLESLLEQPGFSFDLTLEVESLSYHLGLLEASGGENSGSGSGGSSTNQQTSGATAGQQNTTPRQGVSGSQQKNTVSGGGEAGDDEDGDEDKPPRKKSKIGADAVPVDFELIFSQRPLLNVLVRLLLFSRTPEALEALWIAVPKCLKQRINTELTLLLRSIDKHATNPLISETDLVSLGFKDISEAFKWLKNKCSNMFLQDTGLRNDELNLYLLRRANALINREVELAARCCIGVVNGAEMKSLKIIHGGRALIFRSDQAMAIVRQQENGQWSENYQILHDGKTSHPVLHRNEQLLAFQEIDSSRLQVLKFDRKNKLHQHATMPLGPDVRLAFTPGVLLLESFNKGQIEAWKLPESQGSDCSRVETLTEIQLMSISPDHTELAVSSGITIEFYNLQEELPALVSTQQLKVQAAPRIMRFHEGCAFFIVTQKEVLITCAKNEDKRWICTQDVSLGRCFNRMLVSPDGQTLVFYSNHCIQFYCYKDGWQEDYRLFRDGNSFSSVTFSPCNRFVAISRWVSPYGEAPYRMVILMGRNLLINQKEVVINFMHQNALYGPGPVNEEGIPLRLLSNTWQGRQEIDHIVSIQFNPDRTHLAIIAENGKIDIMIMNWEEKIWEHKGRFITAISINQEDEVSEILFFDPKGENLFLQFRGKICIFSMFHDGTPKKPEQPFQIITRYPD